MAGQRLTSPVLLDRSASLLRNCLAVRPTLSTFAPPPPSSSTRPPVATEQRKPPKHTTPELPDTRRTGMKATWFTNKYIVNPSRSPASYLLISRGGHIVRDEKLPFLSSHVHEPQKTEECVFPTPQSSPSLTDLLSVTMPYRRIALKMDHLSSSRKPAQLSPCPVMSGSVSIFAHVLATGTEHVCNVTMVTGTELSSPTLYPESVCSFSPSPTPCTPSRPPLGGKPTPSQLSFILLKLREELPAFFEGHHSYDMYAADMTFENCLGPHPWTARGSAAYAALLSSWRLSLKLCFSHTELDLLKISKDLDSGKIEARWRVRGTLRALWDTKERIVLEAFSSFTVSSDGVISVHKVDKVMPGGKERSRVASWLAQVGVALGLTPSPRTAFH